ncbi:MAG: alpha/beta hydrolase [Treponema sp.]|nr:alpha/beta hydrolase [Treponema sp.]MCL2237850.1 alpha/beta hydrolase [Treponema sp.]
MERNIVFEEQKKSGALKVFIASLIILLLCGIIGNLVHTSGGRVKIHDIKYVTVDGAEMRALLYVPKDATPSTPAPVIISCHGYNNTAEVQDINCIELSRRGFIVMAIDAYGHGSSNFPDERIHPIVGDMGTYSALQYIGTLPYANTKRVGMVGHSLGGTTIQLGAARAWKEHKTNPSIIVPTAVLPTAQSFVLDADGNSILAPYPVNLGAVYGKFDEWALGMWGTVKGSDLNSTAIAKAGMGFNGFKYDTYYEYNSPNPIRRHTAINTAKNGNLRIVYQPPHTHPMIHFNARAVSNVVDFFDITLTNGRLISQTAQFWFVKQFVTGISLIAFFTFITSLGLLLLRTSYFCSIRRPEPRGLTTIRTNTSRIRYLIIYIIGLLPAPLLYNWLVGYPIDITSMGRTVPIVMPANFLFPLPAVNGIFLLNIFLGIIISILYLLVYNIFAKKAGCTYENMGLKLSNYKIFRSAVLAVTVFAAGYFLLTLFDYFFKLDFRFFTLSIKTLTAPKWAIFLRYLPSFLFLFIVTAVSQNTFTRINNQKGWVNMILIVFSSFGGLLALHMIDYIALKHTGVKVFQFVPYPANTTAALAGVLLWGLLFILPVAAVISRIFFSATGSIWTGAFVNSLVVTLFAISNTVIASRGVI